MRTSPIDDRHFLSYAEGPIRTGRYPIDPSKQPAAVRPATLITRNRAVPALPLADGLVLMSVDQGRYFNLDAIGRDVWQRLDQPCSLAELVDRLAADYDAPPETIALDVRVWLTRMADVGIITLS